MNTIIKITGLFFMAFFFSCDKNLDIEPKQNISSEVALSNDQGVKTALNGAYALLADNNVWGGGQFLSVLYADTEDLVWTGTFNQPGEVFDKAIPVNNSFIRNTWSEGYETINLCNGILESLGNVFEGDRAEVEAEARMLRAVVYFDLINMFAKTYVDGDPNANSGVPLVTRYTEALDNLEVPRASVAAVYGQIIEDLHIAKANLPEKKINRFNTYTASGMLSRVYLMQENYAAAMAEADRIIESGEFVLRQDYADLFTSGTSDEDIFKLNGNSGNDFVTFFAASNAGGRGDVSINDVHVEKFEADDVRGQFFYLDGNGVRRTSKWRSVNGSTGDINIMRLSEQYLTRAECRFRAGDNDGATQDINKVRERANASPFDMADLTLDDILNERYLELSLEGFLYRDIKRTKRNFGSIPYNDDRMVYPIPQREMDVNSMLDQNPGY